jgi:hypothetical protein
MPHAAVRYICVMIDSNRFEKWNLTSAPIRPIIQTMETSTPIFCQPLTRRNPLSCVKSITWCLPRHRYHVGVHRTTGRWWPEIKEAIMSRLGNCAARAPKRYDRDVAANDPA